MRLVTETNTYLALKDNYGKVRNEQIFIVSKCISKDSFIKTPKGLIQIRSIKNNSKIEILSYNFREDKIEKDNATLINSGKKEVFEIETESGKKIKASKDHIFFVKEGKSILGEVLGNLKVGNEIVID